MAKKKIESTQPTSKKEQIRQAKAKYVIAVTNNKKLGREMRDYSWQTILNTTVFNKQGKAIQIRDLANAPQKESFTSGEQTLKQLRGRKTTQLDRMNQWSQWSRPIDTAKHNTLPQSLTELARSLNAEKGFEINASYGFGVVYNSFIYNKPIATVKRWFTVDKFDGDIYIDVRRKSKA